MKKNRIDELQRKYGTGKYKKKKEETRIKIEEAEYKLKTGSKKYKKSFKQKIHSPFLRLYIPVLLLIFTIIIILSFKNSVINSYVSKLIIDHEEVKMVSPIYIKDKGEILTNKENRQLATVYMSIEDIRKSLDDNLLYNEKERELVLTGKTSLIQILLDKNEVNINGVKTPLKDEVFKEGIYTYIPINEIIKPLGYNIVISEEFNVVLDSQKNELKTLKLKEDTALKQKQGIFANKILDLNKEDTYILVKEYPRYIKIRTKGGIYGFVNKKKVQNIVVSNKAEGKLKKEDYNYILNYSNPGENPDFINKDKDKKNAVISDMFKVNINDKTGFVVEENFNLKSESYNKYINKIVNQEYMEMFSKIYITKEASRKLDTFSYRIDLIQKIKNKMTEYNIDKIVFQFEEIKDPAAVSRFLIEAKPMLSEESPKIIGAENIEILKAEILEDIIDYYIDLK